MAKILTVVTFARTLGLAIIVVLLNVKPAFAKFLDPENWKKGISFSVEVSPGKNNGLPYYMFNSGDFIFDSRVLFELRDKHFDKVIESNVVPLTKFQTSTFTVLNVDALEIKVKATTTSGDDSFENPVKR